MLGRRLLVTGCGRSGTKYTSLLLTRGGIDVPHEQRLGADGICSWLLAARDRPAPWGPQPSTVRFEYTVHLVRDPLKAIPSITTLNDEAWAFIAGDVSIDAGDAPLRRAAKYWYHWNEMVEDEADLRMRIEDLPDAAEALGPVLGIAFDPRRAEDVPRDLNTRRHGKVVNVVESKLQSIGLVRRRPFRSRLLAGRPPRYEDLTWGDLDAVDPSLTGKIRDKASEYGYAV